MKRITAAKTLATAFATMLILGIAPEASAGDGKGCSNATLTGTFAYTVTGFLVAPQFAGPIAGPFASVGTQTFDGKGGTTATAAVSLNGNILRVTITGTYTVNADCTGSMTTNIYSQNPPTSLTGHLSFAIDDSGAEFRAIQTDPGVVVTGTGRKQFPGND
jgi:hypothetical protein